MPLKGTFCQGMKYINNKGYILIFIISLLAIALAVIATAVSLGFLNIFYYASLDASHKAFYGAESGLQEGLLELSLDRSYTDSAITVGEVDIKISVSESEPDTYVIASKASYNQSGRNLELEVEDIGGSLVVREWREVY